MTNDDELSKIFVEEVNDILEEIGAQLEKWRHAPGNDYLIAILRQLHTLKGITRMIGLLKLGEYTHCLEQVIQRIHANIDFAQPPVIDEVQRALDYFSVYIEGYAKGNPPTDGEIPLEALKKLAENQNVVAEATLISTPAKVPAPEEPLSEKKKKKSGASGEVIRVQEGQLENFSLWASHINIARSHLEQQLRGVTGSLQEMSKEIKWMQEQVRQQQLKTDSNLRIFELGVEEQEYEEFDILEMDKYFFLQQSTRLLAEKLSQMDEFNSLIIHSLRNTDGLLMEQKRSASRLEEGIRHTRLVSFTQLVPRLKRVIRQVSEELNKEVFLDCVKIEGEIDRKVLEKLIPPLEHMVRNAIDHGIEPSIIRVQEGKPSHGSITLSLYRQGNEIVIEMGDDGHGIDIEAIRKRAIEKQIWDSQSPMTKSEAIQMIFLPGFSTKKEITHISGQGVGMDVVNAEVNKLGGTLRIRTEQNLGTLFTIRLPFTLSLHQALVFMVGKQCYALPLSHLVGLSRLSQDEVKKYYKKDHDKLHYGNASYELFSLAALLSDANIRQEWKHNETVPVIFLQSAPHFIALAVDKLIGSCEVVIKPASTQLQFVKEISGVSILGDGQIILILDAPSIITRALTLDAQTFMDEAVKRHVAPNTVPQKFKILIVDDSITVRQVTSRFLKRHDFEPYMAKNGEEVFNILIENVPDVVLLDIEMPEMDGFQVVERMRSDPKYKDIPVIMITSRSSEKHRVRAIKSGANAYLTKPYSEDALLALIRKYQHPFNT